MASYIPVPRDLTKVKSKVAFNLTKRQLICFVIAAAIGVPTFFLLKKLGNSTFAAMGMMIVMMPLFFTILLSAPHSAADFFRLLNSEEPVLYGQSISGSNTVAVYITVEPALLRKLILIGICK